MATPKAARRLIVNADDFGRSHSINQAVVRAHREGILTSASLMVNEAAAEEAAALAREHPQLGVGLHLTLVCGSSASPPAE
ncbi:MAG: hopanoid biosynthesis associated protein HpnK, partial [Verrucomicrobia bacterium]